MNKLDVREDPKLTPAEKETTIRSANDQDRLYITSEQSSVVRWLRDHPQFTEEGRRVVEGSLVAIDGTLPVGCLLLKGRARKDSTTSGFLGSLEVEQDA
jgi:hypothetical protein